MNGIYAVVVLYNPDIKEVLQNISSYESVVEKVILIDNSSNLHEEFKDEKFIYHYMNGNIGLSKALQIGCDEAIRLGAQYIVTFDQDSFFLEDGFKRLIDSLENPDCILAPNIKNIYRDEMGNRISHGDCIYPNSDENINWTITSGMVFSSKVYSMVNGFDTDLFIMLIDKDFCFRLKNDAGCVIKRIGSCIMYQEAGKGTRHKIWTRTVTAPNYPASRYYYVFRNEFYMRNKHKNNKKEWKHYYSAPLAKYFVLVMLFEKNKIQKIMHMFKGYYDAKAGRLGAISAYLRSQ